MESGERPRPTFQDIAKETVSKNYREARYVYDSVDKLYQSLGSQASSGFRTEILGMVQGVRTKSMTQYETSKNLIDAVTPATEISYDEDYVGPCWQMVIKSPGKTIEVGIRRSRSHPDTLHEYISVSGHELDRREQSTQTLFDQFYMLRNSVLGQMHAQPEPAQV